MPSMLEKSQLYLYKKWLCPEIGQVIPLQGNFFSENSYAALINVSPCTNKTTDRPCAPQEQIDNLMDTYGNFYFQINYINPVLNPLQQDYKSYYL